MGAHELCGLVANSKVRKNSGHPSFSDDSAGASIEVKIRLGGFLQGVRRCHVILEGATRSFFFSFVFAFGEFVLK